MKKVTILSSLLCFALFANAQLFEISNDPVFRNQNGDVLKLALCGGLNQPHFSNFDFNNDGKQDLFVFDRTGNKVLTFISETANGVIKYRYEPAYEDFFPTAREFMIFKDYNDDGKDDLWMYKDDSVQLYQNNTNGLPSFSKVETLFALDKVNYVPFAPYKYFSHVTGCLPAIADLDGDEDIDFVTMLGSSNSSLILYCNNSVDSGKVLEDISFEIPDKCFGGIDEAVNGDMIIDAYCYFPESYKKKKHEATKTMMFFDNDDDGDLDLFFGSSEKLSNPIYYFKNGKVELGNFYKDTFIEIDTAFFAPMVESVIPTAPAMSYVDIDLDGVKDLILSSNETVTSSYPIRQTKNVLYFNNKNKNTEPDFEFKGNEFLVDQMVDFGAYSVPCLGDLDGDGDQDLLLATNGDHYVTGDTNDYLVYYENIGSANNPDYKLTTVDYLGLKALKIQGLYPTLADLDGSGILDLFIGKIDGTISHYENTGTTTSPSFSLVTNNFGGLDVGQNAAPCFYDLNKDGLMDVLAGSYAGPIQYYKNTGSTTSPSFTLEDDTLGSILVNQLIRQTILGPNGFRDTFVHQFWSYSSLTIANFGDANQDYLCVGGDEGIVHIYKINNDITADFEECNDYMKRDFIYNDYTKDWGKRVYPSGADINNDGSTDLLIGNNRGGLTFVEGREDKGSSVKIEDLKSFYLAPNPTEGAVKIYTKSNQLMTYTIVDLSGKELQTGSVFSGQVINLSDRLVNGVYFVRLKTNDMQYAPQKLILFK